MPGLTKDTNISTCQKAALIFPGCLSLFPFQEQSGAYDPDSEKDLFHLASVIPFL